VVVRVFQNRMLRRIFGTNLDELTEGWRRRHDEDILDYYCSLTIDIMVKSRRTIGQRVYKD
jgi:hypothetical protein